MERNGVLPTTQFAYRKGLGTCNDFCVCTIYCKVHWRIGRRLGTCRLISEQPLIGLTTRAFSIGSALWVLEVLCCLYRHSFCQTDHSKLWWMVVGVNWLMLFQDCHRGQLLFLIVVTIIVL